MLFSATMPGAVVAMARRYMTQPTHIRAADPDDDGQTVKNIKQVVYRAHALDKVEMLARILQARGRGLTIVFARTKRTAAKVADDLVERGFAAGALHGDLGQGAREQALRAFRNGKVDVLVATDVAARGIDVEAVTHVINYQCPEDEKTYLHRTGRTGRAGAKGTAVTFVDWDDIPRWGLIDKALGLGIPEPIESYSSSAHVYEDLDIPEGTKGRLPKSQQTREGLGAEELEDLGETGKRGGGRPGGGSHSDQIRGNRGGDSRRGSDSRSAVPLRRRRAPRRSGRRAAPGPQAERPADESGEAREGGSRRRRGGRGRGRGEGGAENTTPAPESPANGAAGGAGRRGRAGSGSASQPQPPSHAQRPGGRGRRRPAGVGHRGLTDTGTTRRVRAPRRERAPRRRYAALMKASTASATSCTAIAASSSPAIRVTRMVPESPEDAVDDVGEPHRQVEAHVHGDDAERDGHPVGDGLVGLLDEHHGRDDRAGAGQQRRAQRHQRDVDLAVPRRLRLLHLAGQQLHGDEQQEQPAGRLQRGQRDVHVVEQRLPEQRERHDHAERDEDGLPRGPVALLAGHRAGEAEEDRDRPRAGP